MGLWDRFFGGSEQRQTPGVTPFIDAIRNWTSGISTGIGKAGKGAKRGLAALEEGNYDSDPTLSGYFAPVRDAYATSVREGERSGAMGVGAKFGSDNPVLAQRINSLNESRSAEFEGRTLAGMVPALHQSFSNTLENARAGRRQSQGLQLSGLQSALQGWLSSFYQKQIGGLIPALSQAAGAAGSLAGGFGGGVRPGGGGG